MRRSGSRTTRATGSTRACLRPTWRRGSEWPASPGRGPRAEKGERVARQLEAGATCVNDALMNYFAQEAPFAGMKESGLGARHGTAGIRKYCRSQTILITRFAPSKEPTMFPNSARKAKLLERALVLMYGRKRRSRSGGH